MLGSDLALSSARRQNPHFTIRTGLLSLSLSKLRALPQRTGLSLANGAKSSRLHQDHRRRSRRFEPRGARLRRRGRGPRRIRAAVQAGRRRRDAQHLHLLLGRLRHPDLQRRRPRQERGVRHHPYRGRPGPSGQPRHLVPEGVGAARRRARADPPDRAPLSRPGRRRLQARVLGFRASADRDADEGGPGQELCRKKQGRGHGQPLAHGRGCWRPPPLPTKRRCSPGKSPARSECWSSTIRPVSDTRRR